MPETTTVGNRFLTSSNCTSPYSNYRSTHDTKSLKSMQEEEEVNRKVMEILRRMTAQQPGETDSKPMNQPPATPKSSSRSSKSTKRPLAPSVRPPETNEYTKIARLKVEMPPLPKAPDPPKPTAKPIAPRPSIGSVTAPQSLVHYPLKPQASVQSAPQHGSISTSRRCSCSRSFCLKLYCECFAAGIFCSDCSCVGCYNLAQHEDYRQKAIMRIVHRKPDAFQSKIENASVHARGCNCKRSGCLKNYCECYEARIRCTSRCRCQYCYNMPADNDSTGSPGSHSTGNAHQIPHSFSRSANSSIQDESLFLRSPSSSPTLSPSTTAPKVPQVQEPDGTANVLVQSNTELSQPAIDPASSTAQQSHRSSPSSITSEPSSTAPQDEKKGGSTTALSVGIPGLPPVSVEPNLLLGVNQLNDLQTVGNVLPSNKTVIGLPAAIAASNLLATWLALLSNAALPTGSSSNLPSSVETTSTPPPAHTTTAIVDTDAIDGIPHSYPEPPEQYTTEELAAFDRIIKQREHASVGNQLMSENMKSVDDSRLSSSFLDFQSANEEKRGSLEPNELSSSQRLKDENPPETLPSGEQLTVACKKVSLRRTRTQALAFELARLRCQINQLTRTVQKQGQMIRQLRLSASRRST